MSDTKYKTSVSRCIFGTVVDGDKKIIDGSDDQITSLYSVLNTSKAVQWIVISVEEHDSGNLHYHFLIMHTYTVRKTVLEKTRRDVDIWNGSKCNQIVFNRGIYTDSLAYICKDGDYRIYGKGIDRDTIEKLVERRKSKKTLIEKNTEVGVKTTTERITENDLIEHVKSFMIKRGYQINFYTRRLMGVTDSEFWTEINDSDVVRMYGLKALKLIKFMVYDPTCYVLPIYKPDLNYIEFEDCFWDIKAGRQLSKEECKDVIPVRKYPFCISYEEPVEFLSIINYNKWDKEGFRKHYGETFKYNTGRRTYKTILIHGETTSGKSTLAIPFADVFKDVVGDVVLDGM